MTLDCFFDNFTLKDKEDNWDYKTDLFKDMKVNQNRIIHPFI